MKYYSDDHKKAIGLKRTLDYLEKEHTKFIDNFSSVEKSKDYQLNKKGYNAVFNKGDKEFYEKEDKVYSQYYHLMHKSLNLKNQDDSFMKYKHGFMDEKYINKMFKEKSKKHNKEKNERQTNKKKRA